MATLFFISAMTFLFLLRTFYLLHGLYKTGGSEASGSPWSECKNDGRLARKSNSTNCYRENYERKVSQKDCLNIATVNTVNPVFPVFNIYGIYGKYGIYGHTYQALILLILFLSRRICRVSLLIPPPLGRPGAFNPLSLL